MNEIQTVILLVVMGGMMAYSYRCLAVLRRILVQHGKSPAPLLWNTAILNYAKLSRELAREMTDQEEITKIKAALSKADISIFLTVVVFFVLVGLFLNT